MRRWLFELFAKEKFWPLRQQSQHHKESRAFVIARLKRQLDTCHDSSMLVTMLKC